MKRITVFTPTFNREKLLERCYSSLLNQTNKDFIWFVVDDGSTDNTEILINKWKIENKIEIKYCKKENGGKHTAYNMAMNSIETEFVVVALDSDDYFKSNTIEKIYNRINEMQEKMVGIVGLKIPEIGSDTSFMKKYNINDLQNKSLKEVLINNLLDTECTFIFKTEYVKNFKYPTFKDEHFFTEAYTYYMMDKPMLWTEDELCISEYQNDGLTRNIIKLFINNPKSWRLYNKIRMNNNKSILNRIKYTIYYISFSLISKISPFEELGKGYIKVLILYPIGILGAFFIKIKAKK